MIPGLISVVIPAKDAERWLARAVAGIRRQERVELEIIVVDDGSSDGTCRVADGMADRAIRLSVNQGKSRACNVGLAVARGEFACVHDADDEMLPDKLAAQRSMLRDQPQAGGALVHQVVCVEPGVPLPPWLASNPALADEPSPYAGSALLRMAAVVLSGGLDTGMTLGEDIDLFRRLRTVGHPVVACPEPLLRRWIHGANLTTDMHTDDAWLLVARAAAHNHQRERQLVERVVPEPRGDWSAAVSRNLAVLESRGAIIAFPHPQQDSAIATLVGDPTLDVVGSGAGDGEPPVAVRRTALARAGLWDDDLEPESCARWWQAARRADLTVESLPPGTASRPGIVRAPASKLARSEGLEPPTF